VLDIDVLFYPCPKNGPNFRPKVVQMGGKQQFPYMVRLLLLLLFLFLNLFPSSSPLPKEKGTFNLNVKINLEAREILKFQCLDIVLWNMIQITKKV
jgi:hypothetical protein